MTDQFIARRRPEWERLEELLGRARRGPNDLSPDAIEELGQLYRRATSDLAIARRDFAHDSVRRYLEQLVGRAHPAVYRRGRGDPARLWRFLIAGFPRAVRRGWGYTAISFALLFVPFAAALITTLINPINGRILIAARPFVERIEQGESWLDRAGSAGGPLLSSVVMTNNIQVALLALAGGVLFGLGSVYVLVANGLSLGAVVGLATTYGLGPTLADFVAAHGGIELTVVVLVGGAGLRLGHSLLAPGLLPRRAALARAAQAAIRLLVGCVPLLIIAGLLEGFVSPSTLPTEAKASVGAIATAALYAYLALAGRS